MKKRLLSILLAVCLLVGLLPTVALAEGSGFTAIEGTAGVTTGEGYSSLVDGNKETKWCVNFSGSAYIIFKASEAMKVTGYYITTGNDNESYTGRNPKNWTLYGCNDENAGRDSESWEPIHSVTDDKVLENKNKEAYYYGVTGQEESYQYFKLEITATKGADVMQLSEFTLTSCDHNWVKQETTPATCTTKGYTTYKCTICTNTKIADEVTPLGHAFPSEDGACTRCGKTRAELYTFDVSKGRVTIMDDEYAGKLLVRHGDEYERYIDASQTITVTGTGTDTNSELHVTATTPVTIKAQNLSINTSAKSYANAMSLDTSGANVTLILEGENSFAGGLHRAGISVGAGKTLTIEGTGSLTATGGDSGAGIGGSVNEACGTITINSGTVTATGGEGAAGIGAGSSNSNHGTFQTNNGNAVIFASSIGDNSAEKKAAWSGIIFEGDSGTVYKNQTLTANLTIPTGKTLTVPTGTSLTIPEGKTLTIPEGAAMTNSGQIYVDGTLSGTVGGNGAVYYPLTLINCTADTTNTSDYNSKTYGKAGSTITLTPAIPDGLELEQWDVSLDTVSVDENNSFQMPNAALTVTAQLTWEEVSTETQLRDAINSGETYIKLMADIKLSETLKWQDIQITLDLNGHVLGSGWQAITLTDTSAGGDTSLTLIDSDPNKLNTVGGKAYKGGVLWGKITLTVAVGGSHNCCLYANGGSVTGTVGLDSVDSSIRCTSDTPTVFCDNVSRWGQIYGGIFRGTYTHGIIFGGIFYGTYINTDEVVTYRQTYGGIFYGDNTIDKIAGKTVTFKYNDSTYAREVVSDKSVNKTAVAPIPPKVDDSVNTAEKGYHINWHKVDEAGKIADVSYDFSTPVTEDITLMAQWENTYRITFDTAGGSSVAPFMWVVGTDATLPNAPTRTGYTFTGWNDGTNTYPAGAAYTMPAKDVTFTAQWTINQYTITYGLNGGTATNPTTYTVESGTITLNNPTKTGHTFTGWSGTDLTGENNMTVTIPNGSTGNRSYTAHWTPNIYDVTLITNGGIIREGDVTQYTYGVGAKLPVKVVRSGYIFFGWYDNEACSGTPVTEITTTDIGDKTFYASWLAISGPTTYPPMIEDTEGGSVSVSPKAPGAGDTVTITVNPDKGYTLETLTVTDKNGKSVPVKNNGDGTFTFTQPAGKVKIAVTFMEDNSMLNFFVDVFPGDYYYDAVLWAAENEITGGTGDGLTFSPNASCTRAQAVTFLWRAAGCPEPETMSSFADVSADSYYAKAVAWAVENGITNGTGDGTTFSPNATCTRGQIVTFLWRAQKSPAAAGANSFTDVAADSYCADAVLWAVENGITDGTGDGTTFSPKNDCTRAQIVTFLYRCLAK